MTFVEIEITALHVSDRRAEPRAQLDRALVAEHGESRHRLVRLGLLQAPGDIPPNSFRDHSHA